VLLISGSGAQDRDETVFGHKPFLVLADYLARSGLAVLRVDDRGTGESTGDFAVCTSEDFASDVMAGMEYLRTRDEIDPGKIGLIGHSEGGIIAPMVATRSRDVSFIVLLAGTGLTGEEILYEQTALIARANGATEEAISENRIVQEEIFSVLKDELDDERAEARIREILTDAFTEWTEAEQQAMGYVEAGVEQQLAQVMSPWFRHFLVYDPAPTLKEVKCPVLALIGEKDLQVPPSSNLAPIKRALGEGGNPDFVVKEMLGLNHLFQTATTGSVLEYSRIEETISPAALELIGDWILARTTPKK
jgi:pimeloyl-ACP methyl ester carboxylesterase